MSPIVYRMNAVLSRVVQHVPVGTNLGLFHLLWMLLSGRLLLSRGAVIPGLAALGLAEEAVRRAWAALAYGKWQAAQLLEAWTHLVREEQAFHAHQYGGYRPVACDLVGFFRPAASGLPNSTLLVGRGEGVTRYLAGHRGTRWDSRDPASGRALPPRPGRGDRYPRSRLTVPPPPTCQRAAHCRRSARL
jgi:hypothetical protein